MSIEWFRSWHGAPTDNKWLVIAKRAGVPAGMVSAVVWALFDYASQNENRGSVEDFDIGCLQSAGLTHFRRVAMPFPHTFGAALDRARYEMRRP